MGLMTGKQSWADTQVSGKLRGSGKLGQAAGHTQQLA